MSDSVSKYLELCSEQFCRVGNTYPALVLDADNDKVVGDEGTE